MVKKDNFNGKTKEHDEVEYSIDEVNMIVDDITRQIKNNLDREASTEYQYQRRKHLTNPRRSFPYNRQTNSKPQLVSTNQVRHNPELYQPLNNNFNKTGCSACRRRLWDPI